MSKWFKFYLIVYLLLETNFLYLLPQSWIYEVINIGLIFILIVFNFNKIKNEKSFFKKYIIIFILFICIDMIYSYFKYKQGISNLIYASSYNFLILSYFIFYLYVERFGVKKLISTFIKFSLVFTSLIVIQYLLYSKIVFLNIPVSYRFGSIRINQTTIITNLGLILSFICIFCKDKFINKIIYIINVVMSLICIVFVNKIRMALLIVSFCLLVSFLIIYRRKIYIFIYCTLFAALLGFIYIYYFDPTIYNNYVQSINNIDSDWSKITRDEEREYFINQAINSPVFGVGLLNPVNGTESYTIIRGSLGKYYTNDVGVYGLLQSYGFTGVILYLYLIIIIGVNIKRYKKYDAINITLFIYILLTSYTLIIMDKYRNFMLPILFVIFEFYNNKYKQINPQKRRSKLKIKF